MLGWLRSKLHCFIGLPGCSEWLLSGGFLLVKVKRVLCDILVYDSLFYFIYVASVPLFFNFFFYVLFFAHTTDSTWPTLSRAQISDGQYRRWTH